MGVATAEKALLLRAHQHWAAGRADAAIADAWASYRLQPHDAEAKVLLASLMGEFPSRIAPEMHDGVLRLLQDEDVAPDYISTAGWLLLMREPWWTAAESDADCETLATQINANALALALLRETPVYHRDAERILTRLRRWLLLSRRWQEYPLLKDALAAQAALNGGAWPFGEAERALLEAATSPMYLPDTSSTLSHPDFADPVTRAVAEDYERWPYPRWRRIMASGVAHRLSDHVRALDPGGPELPANAKILIAGCGTGSEAAQAAREYPDATITAIDISKASLAYARSQWAALGLNGIRFEHLDLHRVAALKERFDAIFCSGVLHHLPDPERGWAALTSVLRAGGVMRIMLYSRIARAWIAQARTLIADLTAGAVDDDVLRAVRRRFLDRPLDALTAQVVHASAFATLSGTHDLLLHRREDPFDIPRIGRALERLRLRLLTFEIAAPDAAARYDATFPNDRMHRNLQSLAFYERSNPSVFISQYSFWCRSEAFWLR